VPDVIVTGASGFIGKAVCEELLKRCVTVYGLGRTKLAGVTGIQYYQVQRHDQFRAPSGAICIHLAGENDPKHVAANFQDEKDSTITLAQMLATRGFARVIYASSALVYGDRVSEPRREVDPLNPLGSYATLKVVAEDIFLAHGHGVARLANVYGPGMSSVNLLSDILRQIPGKGVLHVYDTTPVRDYVHVTDVARGLADMALGKATGIFNLGTGTGITVGQLTACLARYAGEEGRAIVPRVTNHQPSTLVLDPSKMSETFGWKAQVELPDGVKELVEQRLSEVSGNNP